MYGLINKAIEIFVTDTYGAARWQAVMGQADLGVTQFEAMLPYDAHVTDEVLQAMSVVLGRSSAHMLEDLGTYLVVSPSMPSFRRLLRFGGVDYVDFLHSLADMPDRVRLAIGDLRLPALDLIERPNNVFHLHCHAGLPGYGHVMLGILRAMADDYGALALLELNPHASGGADINIQVVLDAFSAGNAFQMGSASA